VGLDGGSYLGSIGHRRCGKPEPTYIWVKLPDTEKVQVLLEEDSPCKILSLLEYNNLVPAQGPSQDTCPQEEFCSQKKEVCRGLLCTVTCHEGL